MSLLGEIDFGNGSLLFYEKCNAQNSINIGTSDDTYKMNIDYATLAKITGEFNPSNYITFHSQYGHVQISNVIQENHLMNANDAQIQIIDSSLLGISFNVGQSIFHTLDIESQGGIVQEKDIIVTVGTITVDYTGKNICFFI